MEIAGVIAVLLKLLDHISVYMAFLCALSFIGIIFFCVVKIVYLMRRKSLEISKVESFFFGTLVALVVLSILAFTLRKNILISSYETLLRDTDLQIFLQENRIAESDQGRLVSSLLGYIPSKGDAGSSPTEQYSLELVAVPEGRSLTLSLERDSSDQSLYWVRYKDTAAASTLFFVNINDLDGFIR